MRHDKIIAARAYPCVFVCTCCEVAEHSPDPTAPAGWTIEYIDGKSYALCGDCGIDAPDADRPAGVTSTRVGVPSQLDIAAQFEWDEEDMRHAQRLVGIARAERIGRAALPALLVAIALIGIPSIVQHSIRWISM